MKFTRSGFSWLERQVDRLGNIVLSPEELEFLKKSCVYLSEEYLNFLSTFRLYPSKQIHLSFHPTNDTGSEDDVGDIDLHTTGTWLDTILYEIPLLALTSEAYFKFVDRDWSHDGQVEQAKDKGVQLLKNGCLFSEFGSRRRRDYHTHDLILQGLVQAQEEGSRSGWKGKLAGTSNVHFAMKHNLTPVGTVAHEWFMGVAAVTNNYEGANELALRYWVETYGKGILGIALTDTFGTEDFLKAFKKPIPSSKATEAEQKSGLPSYAEVFTGVRQDSGDPETFAKLMRKFYDGEGIMDKKAVVFSDSLNVELCLRYKKIAEELNLQPSFGVGTFFTSKSRPSRHFFMHVPNFTPDDFVRLSTGHKSVPLNIVIKISSAGGRPAVKISDNIGKNTGDKAIVAEVKQRLGYRELEWKDGDERTRWGKDEDPQELKSKS
jgi:nicotinate phosphoribosyltransferase